MEIVGKINCTLASGKWNQDGGHLSSGQEMGTCIDLKTVMETHQWYLYLVFRRRITNRYMRVLETQVYLLETQVYLCLVIEICVLSSRGGSRPHAAASCLFAIASSRMALAGL